MVSTCAYIEVIVHVSSGKHNLSYKSFIMNVSIK